MLIRTLATLVLIAATGTALAANVKGNATAGQEKSKTCAACHGPTGKESTDNQYPLLAGQHPEYLVKALQDYKTGKRKNPIMAGFAGGLSDQDINDLAVYFSNQTSNLHDLSEISAR